MANRDATAAWGRRVFLNPNPLGRLDEFEAREQIVEVCRRMHERGLIAGGEGNVSVRLGQGRILITPSGINKGFLKPADLALLDETGRAKRRGPRASSEFRLHLAAYEARPDCGAVLHAHPPYAIALTIADLPLSQDLIPESVVSLGRVPTAAYATPSTPALAEGVGDLLAHHDIVMMARHGSVCVGPDLATAYDRLESLEHTARITVIARSLGPVHPLDPIEVARLRALAGDPDPVASAAASEEALVREIAARVLAAISSR